MVYTVGEMAKMLGVSASTLRYYDPRKRQTLARCKEGQLVQSYCSRGPR